MSARTYFFKVPFLQTSPKDKWTVETANHQSSGKAKYDFVSQRLNMEQSKNGK